MMHPQHSRRPYWIYGIFTVLFLVIIARAWYLQVTAAELNLARAGWKTETVSTITAPRGAIWDRHGLPLAESVEAYNLSIDPRAFFSQARGSEEKMAELLTQFPAFDSEAFLAMAELPQTSIPQYMRVARGVSPHEMQTVQRAAAQFGTNAFIVETAYRRYYPLKGVAGAIIGFVDAEGTAGRSGIEGAMNEMLEGGSLSYTVTRDARRDPYLLGDLPNLNDVRGVTLELSIDARLQRFAEEVLARVVERFKAHEAMAVVTNVQTGELLALATVPVFDPNDPFSHPEEFLWASHAVSHALEPGSTAKVLTYAAALNEGNLRMDTMLDCENGSIRLNNRLIRDTTPVEVVPAWKALQVSSNVCSWKVASTMSDATHHQYLRDFGLGERPAIPIAGAAMGIVPTPSWIEVQQANISFGHAFSASILQLHYALSTVANGGRRMEPMVLRRLRFGDGRVEERRPQVAAEVLRPEVSRSMLRAMESIVYDEDGTGKEGAIRGTRVAAKTGTARLVDTERGGYLRQYMGSYTGFFPAENPVYGISVWVVRPDPQIAYYGGRVAAPAFREIGQEVLRLYGAPPSEWAADIDEAVADLKLEAPTPAEPVEEDDAALFKRPGIVPPLVGLRASEALEELQRRNMSVRMYGTGRVAVQEPGKGELLRQGQQVVLQLAPEGVR